jgi:putative ABC transport system permease protein
VRAGASGPFLGSSPISLDEASYLAALPGVDSAGPVLFTRKSTRSPSGSDVDVNIVGAVSGRPGMPVADRGRQPAQPGEMLASTKLTGYGIGDVVDVSGTPMTIVGQLVESTSLAGTPNVAMSIADAQRIGFAGAPIASTVAVSGSPSVVPDGFEVVSNGVARADLLRAIAKAKSSLLLITVLLWLVAASIIGAVVYLSVLERLRDFAVFKATGVATRSILGGMVLQAAILALTAALAGSVVGVVLGPRFPMIVALELRAHLLLPVVAVVIGTVASLGGMRRVVTVDPALAFGGP